MQEIVERVVDEAEENDVAIRRRLRGELRGDRTIGAGTILDNHRLTERLVQFRRNLTDTHVGCAAGNRRNDDANRLHWKALSAGGAAA